MTEPVDLDQVLEDVRAAAAQARASGVYPDGLEEALQSDFARQLRRPDPRERIVHLRNELERLRSSARLDRSAVPTDSSIPGGSAAHKAVGKAVGRQIGGLYDQLNEFIDDLLPVIGHVVDGLQDPRSHIHDDLVQELDTVQDRCRGAAADPRPARGVVPRQRLGDGAHGRAPERLRRRQRQAGAPRGGRTTSGLRPLLRLRRLRGRRGGVPPRTSASSTESSPTASAARPARSSTSEPVGASSSSCCASVTCRAGASRSTRRWCAASRGTGLDIRLSDGLDALREVPFGSLGAIVLLHVIEHLTPNELLELVELSFDRLAPGGSLVLETPNPQSLYVFARAFWLDPTHSKPVHPVYLDFVVRRAGFLELEFEWTAFPAEAERLVEPSDDSELAAAVAENARRVNAVVFRRTATTRVVARR
ncbi:MAG: hypothetical protein V9E94_08760 [Microthrixaceae bacterium]